MNDLILSRLKLLPASSGVYIMLDAKNKIIYIGKAKNLKNRVSQYFLHGAHNQKVTLMVQNVHDFQYILTNSENDALLIEANLIKKHKPKYNILLKDDKYFPYLKINLNEDFPKVEIVRRLSREKCKFFGPFLGGVHAKELLEIISAAYPLRTCKQKLGLKTKKSRGCLNSFTGKCIAPCTGNVSKEEYDEIIEQVVAFLKGNVAKTRQILTEKMLKAAEGENFELAQSCKERLEMLKRLENQPISLKQKADIDVFSFSSNGEFASVSAIFVRDGRIVGSKNFPLMDILSDEDETCCNFLYNFYLKNPVFPKEIILSKNLDFEGLEDVFRTEYERNIKIFMPQKGVKRQLLDMARANSNEYLTKNLELLEHKEKTKFAALKLLKEAIGMEKLPSRIECFDISNLSGTDKTASMAVCIDGVMEHKLYRKFKVKTVEGIDDYKSLSEVLSRRLARLLDEDESFSQTPDLIVIDGGKGQLSAVCEQIEAQGIKVISLAKKDEEIFLPKTSQPIRLPKSHLALRLLQKIRDESHRFAITYHRTLRKNKLII